MATSVVSSQYDRNRTSVSASEKRRPRDIYASEEIVLGEERRQIAIPVGVVALKEFLGPCKATFDKLSQRNQEALFCRARGVQLCPALQPVCGNREHLAGEVAH